MFGLLLRPAFGVHPNGLQVKYRDVEHTNITLMQEFGPNQALCRNGGAPVDDANEFDGNYTCDCTGLAFSGLNCELGALAVVCETNQSLDEEKQECSTFVPQWNPTRPAGEFNPEATPYFAVGETYLISALELDKNATRPSAGTFDELRYAVRGLVFVVVV